MVQAYCEWGRTGDDLQQGSYEGVQKGVGGGREVLCLSVQALSHRKRGAWGMDQAW